MVSTTVDAQNYIVWINKNGTPILSFMGYAGYQQLDSNETWTTPAGSRLRFHGPGDSSMISIGIGPEGKGPYWPDIPPGENWSHYYTNTTYTKKMAQGIFSTYNLNNILATRYFNPIYKEYDLLYNVTADKRVSGYPLFPDSAVPELDMRIALLLVPTAMLLYRIRRKKKISL